MNEDAVIEAKGLTKKYGSATAVDQVSFAVGRGEIFGLLGPNGAGKTTTILMLLGLTDISGGEVRVLGFNPAREPLSVKRRVGYLPDTVGFILPDALHALIENLYARVPALSDAVLSFHGQDDLGLATANALAAVRAGARQLEVTVNGIGERAGNTCFEEVVMALHVHAATLNVETGVNTRAIHELSKLVEERSGLAIASNKAIVGRNAFRHASGVHQDGVLKQRETYEVIDPAEIGHPVGTEIVLGKLSGRAGFAARALKLGFELRGAALERAFCHFQELADRKREIADDDVQRICLTVAADAA